MFEDEFARCVRGVGPDVLLDVGVLVVIHSNTLVASQLCQISDEGGFANTGVSLKRKCTDSKRSRSGSGFCIVNQIRIYL